MKTLPLLSTLCVVGAVLGCARLASARRPPPNVFVELRNLCETPVVEPATGYVVKSTFSFGRAATPTNSFTNVFLGDLQALSPYTASFDASLAFALSTVTLVAQPVKGGLLVSGESEIETFSEQGPFVTELEPSFLAWPKPGENYESTIAAEVGSTDYPNSVWRLNCGNPTPIVGDEN